MNKIILIFVLAFGMFPYRLNAQSPLSASSSEDPTHNELRMLRDGLINAMNKGDIEEQLKYLHPNVVITFQNAEVARGRNSVKAYYDKMTSGPNKIVKNFHASVNVDELTILYGDSTGISFGSSIESFKLTNGMNFDLKGRWTATLVKENGRWLIASLHASTNLFDNPLLNMAKKTFYWVGGLCLTLGLAIGWWISRKRKIVT